MTETGDEPLLTNQVGQQAIVPPLRYAINGRPAFSHLTVFLSDTDEGVLADSGAMLWMDSSLQTETSCGGCLDSCARQCSGEGACLNTFHGNGYISLGTAEPGDMMAFAVTPGHAWVVGARAFVAGSTNLSISCRCGNICGVCMGEDLFQTRISVKDDKPGIFFAAGYGQIIRHEVPDGQSLYVNNSLFFASHEDVRPSISLPGGCLTCCFGKEGFVMRFDGPCVVYTQSRDPRIMDRLTQALQAKKAKKGEQARVAGVTGGAAA